MSSSTTVVNCPPPDRRLTGYQGGGLARIITSNDIFPTESLVGRRGREQELQDRDEDVSEPQQRGIEAGLTAQKSERQGGTGGGGGAGGTQDAVFVEGKGQEIAEEWIFPDGGWKAWSVIFGCWLYSCNVQGYGMCWGALVSDLQRHHPSTDLATINLIVGLQNFGLNASPFLTGRLGELFGFKRMIAIGSVLSVILLVCSAVAVDSLPALFVLQGILLGVAHGISLPLFMTIPSQWFSRRRGLATGITVSGTGFGGAIASLIIRGILPTLGYRNTLLVYAGISAVVYVCAWFLLKTRKPPARAVPARYDTKTGLPPGIWKDPAFYSLMASVSVAVWGFLTPSYYLTDYTAAMDPSRDPNALTTALPLIVQNLGIGIGRIAAGSIADWVGPANAMFFTFLAGGVLQLAMWSHVTSYGGLMAFAALYGLFGGWFFLLMPGVAANLFGLRGLATITGYVVASQSPGQLAGATVSGVVLSSSGKYSNVGYYAGAMMLGGALLILPARFLRQPKLLAVY